MIDNSVQQTGSILKRFALKVEETENQDFPAPELQTIQTEKRTLFISYSWKVRKNEIHRMADLLIERKEFNVWIDRENMQGPVYDAMAQGINSADLVLVFFSREYEKSANCKREIEYAANKNKQLLPIRVERDYQPDDWLLLIFGSRNRIDFCEGDNFDDAAARIVKELRGYLLPASINKLFKPSAEPGREIIKFQTVKVPRFSNSKYYSRKSDEQRILSQIQVIGQNPDVGCLVITADGGVGKTTLLAHICTEKTNQDFFVNECNLHLVFWLNCFEWRDTDFDEKQEQLFTEKIISLAKEADRSAHLFYLNEIAPHFKKQRRRIVFILDDMFNTKLIEYFMQNQDEAVSCCVITRDPDAIARSQLDLVKKIENINVLSDEGIKDMLNTCYGLNGKYSDQQMTKLAERCCGLPLIASLIAARLKVNESEEELNAAYELLIAQSVGNLDLENRSFKTVSQLFEFSLNQIDQSMRRCFYAFLFFEPAEQIAVSNLAIFWGFDVQQNGTICARGMCNAFEKRSLVRRAVREENDKEDKFFIHQMLHEAAAEMALREYAVSTLQEIRFKIATGQARSSTRGNMAHVDEPYLSVVVETLKQKKRELLESFVVKLDAENLAQIIAKSSVTMTKGMCFLHYLYQFVWDDDVRNLKATLRLRYNFNPSFRLIKRILLKLKASSIDLFPIISKTDSKTGRSSLLYGVFRDNENFASQYFERLPLLTLLGSWETYYNEVKWEQKVLQNGDKAIIFAMNNCLPDVQQLCADAEKTAIGKALQAAARKNNLDVVKCLVERCQDSVKERDEDGRTALMLGAMNGHFEVVEYLFQKGSEEDLNLQDKGSQNALMLAAKNGHLTLVKWLYSKHPASVETKSKFGRTALMLAVQYGRYDCAKFLSEDERREGVKATDCYQCTALMIAASFGHLVIVQDLYEKYPEAVQFKSWKDQTALMFSARRGFLDIVEFIYERHKEMLKFQDQDGRVPVMTAAESGHLEVVRFLTEQDNDGSTLRFVDWRKQTALMCAARSGQVKVVHYLYTKYPDAVKVQDKNGKTALMLAAENGHSELVEVLFSKYPEAIEVPDKIGRRAIHLAARDGHLKTVEFLVGKASDSIFAKDNHGRTPMLLAASNGHLPAVEFFITKDKVGSHSVDKLGRRAITLAVDFGYFDVVRFLAQQYPEDVDAQDNHGQTALIVAAKNGFVKVVEFLVESAKASLTVKDSNDHTAFMAAVRSGEIDVVRYFGPKMSTSNDLDKKGRSAIALSAEKGHSDIVEYLCDTNPPFDLNAQIEAALILAEERKHQEVVEYFITRNTQPFQEILKNGSPQRIAATIRVQSSFLSNLIEVVSANAVTNGSQKMLSTWYPPLRKLSLDEAEICKQIGTSDVLKRFELVLSACNERHSKSNSVESEIEEDILSILQHVANTDDLVGNLVQNSSLTMEISRRLAAKCFSAGDCTVVAIAAHVLAIVVSHMEDGKEKETIDTELSAAFNGKCGSTIDTNRFSIPSTIGALKRILLKSGISSGVLCYCLWVLSALAGSSPEVANQLQMNDLFEVVENLSNTMSGVEQEGAKQFLNFKPVATTDERKNDKKDETSDTESLNSNFSVDC